jgi:hypothetical protein
VAIDFDDYMDEQYDEDNKWWDDDLDGEFTPEEIADIRRGEQDANMGFVYEMVDGEDGDSAFRCGKCGRVAPIHETPFPHRFGCPMKSHDGDED